MNSLCFSCNRYPSDCDGVDESLPVAGCIELPGDSAYDSAMIDNDYDDDERQHSARSPSYLVANGRGREHPAFGGPGSVPTAAGSPAGVLLHSLLPAGAGSRIRSGFGFLPPEAEHTEIARVRPVPAETVAPAGPPLPAGPGRFIGGGVTS